MKKVIIYIMILFSTFACNNKRKEQKGETMNNILKNENINDDIFKVLVNVNISNDDKFQLFYTKDSPEEGFSDKKRVVQYIKARDSFQTVIFNLPAKVLPYKFRIDLGENKIETPVYIKWVRLELNQNAIQINDSILDRMFQPNIYLQKVDLGVFLRKLVNNKYDPFLSSSALLDKKIELDL